MVLQPIIKPTTLIGILLSSRCLEHSRISVSSLHAQDVDVDVKSNLDHQINIDQIVFILASTTVDPRFEIAQITSALNILSNVSTIKYSTALFSNITN